MRQGLASEAQRGLDKQELPPSFLTFIKHWIVGLILVVVRNDITGLLAWTDGGPLPADARVLDSAVPEDGSPRHAIRKHAPAVVVAHRPVRVGIPSADGNPHCGLRLEFILGVQASRLGGGCDPVITETARNRRRSIGFTG